MEKLMHLDKDAVEQAPYFLDLVLSDLFQNLKVPLLVSVFRPI